MKLRYNIKAIVNTMAVVLLAFFISGCLGDMFSKNPEGDSSADQPKARKTTAVYYDFEDVLIPMELSVVKDRTVVILTPGFTSGILTLKGRVERRSLFNFFSNNMQKDNWNVISQIKSPATTIMVFQKISRTAVITIRDEHIYTYVEVGVAPTVAGEPGLSESNLLK
jgi:PBP1b-binding outer membrane lipoprotein LpoB